MGAGHWSQESEPRWLTRKSSEIRRMIESEPALTYEPWWEVEQPRIDALQGQLESLPQVELPPDVLPAGLDTAYPDLDAVAGRDVISKRTGAITDDQIEAILSGSRREHFHYGDLLHYLLKVMLGDGDPRAVRIAIRIARDLKYRSHWKLAFKLMATRRCEEVDDFFVEYLCARDQPDRPEIIAIIDDYFRHANPSAE